MLNQNISSTNSGGTSNGFGVLQSHTGSFFDVFASNLYTNCGTGTISGTTAIIANGYVTSTSIIMLTKTSSVADVLYVSDVSDGSFTVTGGNGATFNWFIANSNYEGQYGY